MSTHVALRASSRPHHFSDRAYWPVSAITCDPACAPDVTLITLWRGRNYRVQEHFNLGARALADLLKTLRDQHRAAALHVNPAGTGRAVALHLADSGVPVHPWASGPSPNVAHHAADALAYAVSAYQAAPDRARADIALRDSLDLIAYALAMPARPAAPPAPSRWRVLLDPPWFYVGCAVLGMLLGTTMVSIAYFFQSN